MAKRITVSYDVIVDNDEAVDVLKNIHPAKYINALFAVLSRQKPLQHIGFSVSAPSFTLRRETFFHPKEV